MRIIFEAGLPMYWDPGSGPIHWLNSLEQAARQRVFAAMRNQEAAMLRYYSSPSQGCTGLPVGAQHFDDMMQAEVRREFMAGIRKGFTPRHAAWDAKQAAKQYIERHNSRRPADINWKRAADEYGPLLDWAAAHMLEASAVISAIPVSPPADVSSTPVVMAPNVLPAVKHK